MKTVMIVDDERPARELLKMTCDWNAAGFEILCEARNGREALKLYENLTPDLVITDIQMPVMDGLDLIKEIRTRNPHQKIAILSCHEDFSYAKRALRLGVMDYLIKDELTEDALYNMLRGVLAQPAAAKPTPAAPKAAQGTSNVLPLVMRDGVPPEQYAQLMEDLLCNGKAYFCCMVKPEGRHKLPQQFAENCEKIRTVLSALDGGEVYLLNDGVFLVLVLLSPSCSKMILHNNRFSVIQQIRAGIEGELNCPITVGVSDCSKSPFAVRQMIEEAQQALAYRVFLGKGRTLYYGSEQNHTHMVQIDVLNLRIDKIKAAIDHMDLSQLKQEITTLYEKDIRGIMQYNYVQYINALLMGLITTRCSSENIAYDVVFDSCMTPMNELESLETVQEMCDWFIERFSRFLPALRKQTNQDHSPRLHRILAYIQENYTRDINLDTLADHFGLHKVYLAKIFKSEFNESINGYIHKLRIEKAKELLCNEEVRIGDIIDMAGFNNPQSFYVIFKRFVGASPGEYREQQLIKKHKEFSEQVRSKI